MYQRSRILRLNNKNNQKKETMKNLITILLMFIASIASAVLTIDTSKLPNAGCAGTNITIYYSDATTGVGKPIVLMLTDTSGATFSGQLVISASSSANLSSGSSKADFIIPSTVLASNNYKIRLAAEIAPNTYTGNSYIVPLIINSKKMLQITSQTDACVGGPSFSLTGTPSSGSWQGLDGGFDYVPGGAIFNPSSVGAGNYRVVYNTTLAGCGSATDTAVITVFALPTIPTITQNVAVLTSSSPTGNQWYLNSAILTGETGQNLTTAQNGQYTVEVTNAGGCTSTSSPYNMTSTGINSENRLETNVAIYPNPSNGEFTLQMDLDKRTDVQINIVSMTGQLVKSSLISQISGSIVLPIVIDYEPGIYLVNITDMNLGKSITQRITIQ